MYFFLTNQTLIEYINDMVIHQQDINDTAFILNACKVTMSNVSSNTEKKTINKI